MAEIRVQDGARSTIWRFRFGTRVPHRGYTSVANNRADATPVTDASISDGFRMRLDTNKPNPNSSPLAILAAGE
jgi:hypothetical protein